MRIVIFSGGNLDTWALSYITKHDFIIGVDRGAYYLYTNGIEMDVAIGDFDSVSENEKEAIISKSKQIYSFDAVDKDKTDTEIAFDYAVAHKPTEILFLGVLGTRFDHSLANVYLLEKSRQAGIKAKIVDKYNEIFIVNKDLRIHNDNFSNISLLPLTAEVTGVTLQGFQYPLENATIKMGETIGISNILQETVGAIAVGTGTLLVIKSND